VSYPETPNWCTGIRELVEASLRDRTWGVGDAAEFAKMGSMSPRRQSAGKGVDWLEGQIDSGGWCATYRSQNRPSPFAGSRGWHEHV